MPQVPFNEALLVKGLVSKYSLTNICCLLQWYLKSGAKPA